MDFSKLSYSDIENIAGDLDNQANNMATVLERVKSYFQTVGDGSSTWSGDAANHAREEFDSLSSQFHLFNEAVTSCASYLRQMVANYQAVDTAAKSNIDF